MKNIDWLSFFKLVASNTGSGKLFSKAVVKSIVMFVLKFSGLKGWIAGQILYPLLKSALIDLYTLPQVFKDHAAVKKFKKEIESGKGNTDERKKLEESILTGNKP